MAPVDDMIANAQMRMTKSVEHARNEFNTVRTGRASASLLDRIDVDYYGTKTQLKQLATIGVPDRKSTRLNSSHIQKSRMPSSA